MTNRNSSAWTKVALLGVIGLAFFLRAYRLDSQSYWIDEAWTLFYAQQSLPELWVSLNTIRAAPPLYHLLTIGWQAGLGTSEYAMRFISLGFSVLSVPLMYRLGKLLHGPGLGLLSAFLLAIAPYQIWHAQDARNYAMLTALALLSMVSFLALWRGTTARRGWWGWYILGTGLAVFTHYHALMIVGVQGLFFLLTWRRHAKFYLPWGVVLALVLTPLALWLTFGSQLWQSDHWLPQIGLLDSYWRGAVAYSIGELVPLPLKVWLTLPFLGLYAWGLIYAARHRWGKWHGREMLALLLAFTLAPNVAAWLYSITNTPIYLERYLIVVQIGYLLTVAIGLWGLSEGLAGWVQQKFFIKTISLSVTTIGLTVICGWVLWQHYHNPVYAKPDWRQVTDTLEAHALPGDAIILTGDGGEMLFDYYYQGQAPVYTSFNTPAPSPSEAATLLTELSQQARRVWFTPYGVPIDSTLRAWFSDNAYPAWHQWLGRKELMLYHTAPFTAPATSLEHQFRAGADLSVTLDEASWPSQPLVAGDTLPLRLRWQANEAFATPLHLSMRLVNRQGDIFAQSDWPPLPNLAETSLDQRALWIPAHVPPATYTVQLIVYQADTGQAVGAPLALTQVAVAPSPITPPPSAFTIPNRRAVSPPTAQAQVLGYAYPAELQPGQTMWLWLYWQAPAQPLTGSPMLHLMMQGDQQVFSHTLSLADVLGPLEQWHSGQLRRGVVHWPTSPYLSGQQATLSLALADSSPINLGQVQLKTRPHNFTPPPVPVLTPASFGEPTLIDLLGYQLEPPTSADPTALTLTLFWQAQQEMQADYTVFVQVLNAAGQVVAQVDAPPLQGQAPTTTWLPTEYLTDPYQLSLPTDLPPGDYTVITGLYQLETGQRLPAFQADGQAWPNQAVPIRSFSVDEAGLIQP